MVPRPARAYRADVPSWVVYLGSTVLVVLAAAWAIDLAMRAFTGTLRYVPRRRPVRGGTARAGARALPAVAADLRRLRRELALVGSGTSAAHRAGLAAAYDDVLVEAAAALDVAHRLRSAAPGEDREVERLRVETALVDAGLPTTDPQDRR